MDSEKSKICKNCVNFLPYSDGIGYCRLTRDTLESLWVRIQVSEDWYCADFEAFVTSNRKFDVVDFPKKIL